MRLEDQIKLAAEVVREADAILIGAGAGMGVDSGLPDFRGNQGFWKAYPIIARLGLSFSEMANPTWFRRSPNLAWAFYGHRLNLYRKTTPHAGFARLLRLASAKPEGYFVYTSNVDGHFQKAGFPAGRIVECHGSIHHFQCAQPCSDRIWPSEDEVVNVDEERFSALDPLPRCEACLGLARPNVLMFGDALWIPNRLAVQERAWSAWLKGVSRLRAKLVAIEMGAGTAVPSVRFAAESIVGAYNGRLIRINPRETEVPEGQIGLACGAAEGIARLCDALGLA